MTTSSARIIADPAKAAVAEDFFANCVRQIATPIDPRTDKELLDDATHHSDPPVREHALFEYIYRHERDAFPVVLKAWEGETETAVQISLFEELVRLDYTGFKRYLEQHGIAKSLEAHAHTHFDRPMIETKRVAKSDPGELFDQVLPLRVTLREYLEVEPNKWMYHVFSPLQEKRVAGQLYACSKVETRSTRIVLTKQLEGLHSDGSLHIENTLFSGRTAMLDKHTSAFSFKTLLKVPFYFSGRIGDRSEGFIADAQVEVVRSGTWTTDAAIMVRGIPVINNVTGIIRTWGYTRPDKATFDPGGRMDLIAGLFHLGDLIDPRTRDYINSYTVGTYRGVLQPGEDGRIGLNSHPSYATLDGEIDRDRDGVAEKPGEQYDVCPGVHSIEHYTTGTSKARVARPPIKS